MNQVEWVSQGVTPIIVAAAYENIDAHGVDVQSPIHLLWPSLHVGIISFQSLLHSQQENDVDEDNAVGANQVKHLEGLSVPQVLAFRLIVHLLNKHVSPNVECQHTG